VGLSRCTEQTQRVKGRVPVIYSAMTKRILFIIYLIRDTPTRNSQDQQLTWR